MKRIKYENIVFITLVGMYIWGALNRECDLITNLTTLSMQLLICVGIRSIIRYTRKNFNQIKKEVGKLLIEN